MTHAPALWASPRQHLRAFVPDHPVLYVAPTVLQATARRFIDGFPGLVTYAVKANDADVVLENLMAAGLTTFDVASPDEMLRVRSLMPSAVLHYNNPVRSPAEIDAAVALGCVSYSVDCVSEFEKLRAGGVPAGTEIAVRLKLPVAGAAYDFGAKFGATPEAAADLLRRVATAGFTPAMTFHPGTQCNDGAAWAAYIAACAAVAADAGVTLSRLNVGGGYPARRGGEAPDLARIFDAIADAARASFGTPPTLLCEPGRAMVADAFSLAARVKALREDGSVFLNDGLYGGFAEFPSIGGTRLDVVSLSGDRAGAPVERTVWGPTCDSLDRLPQPVGVPTDLSEGDWLLFHGMGAYTAATATRFNGYGALQTVTVARLTA